MKILLAAHHFPPQFLGGAEWQAYRMARWLRAAGHEVRVLCVASDTQGRVGELTCQDESYQGLPVRRLAFNLPAVPDPLRWSFRNPLVERHTEALLAEFQPDLLHLVSGYLLSGSVLAAAETLGFPTVLMPMDYWFLCPRITLLHPDGCLCPVPEDRCACVICLRQDKRRYRWANAVTGGRATRWLRALGSSRFCPKGWRARAARETLRERDRYLQERFAAASAVVVNSRFLQRTLEQHGFTARRLIQVRQGLELSPSAGTRLARSDGVFRIGYVGQLVHYKGVATLVRAFRQLPPTGCPLELVLYGDPTRFPAFARDLRRGIGHDARIRLAGTFTHDRLAEVYGGLDLLVVPSLWYENSPNAILEAQAFQVPVIASNLGGIPELVQDEVNGLLFEPGNPAALARQLHRAVAEPGLLARLRAGIGPVKRLDEEMQELVQVYREVRGEQGR